MLPIGRKSVWSWFKLNVVILHVSLVSVAETSSCLPNILSHLFPYQYDHVYIYMGGLQCVQLKGCVSQPLLQMGGSLKSLVRLPGRIVKEGSQQAAPCAISLPPSCLQCDCEGRSSGSCLWPQGQGPQPMVEHTAGGKLGSWWHGGMSTLSHTGHRLTLHETERNPLLAYLGFQTNTIRCQVTILPEPQRAARPAMSTARPQSLGLTSWTLNTNILFWIQVHSL